MNLEIRDNVDQWFENPAQSIQNVLDYDQIVDKDYS